MYYCAKIFSYVRCSSSNPFSSSFAVIIFCLSETKLLYCSNSASKAESSSASGPFGYLTSIELCTRWALLFKVSLTYRICCKCSLLFWISVSILCKPCDISSSFLSFKASVLFSFFNSEAATSLEFSYYAIYNLISIPVFFKCSIFLCISSYSFLTSLVSFSPF